MTVDETAEDFEPYIGQVFQVKDGHQILTLTRVDRMPAGATAPRQPFLLIFRGPPDDMVAEGIRTFAMPDGRILTFYIMPIQTPQRDHQAYQAVFN